MRSSFPRLSVAAGAAALALVACQSKPPTPPPSAVLDISSKTCGQVVNLETAEPLTPKKTQKWVDIHTAVDETSACVTSGGQSGNYVVYELPEHATNHVITVGGAKQKIRLLAPAVSMLDSNGELVRTFIADKYQYIGGVFGVQLRPNEGERYLLVKTDSDLVGNVEEVFETRMVTQTGYASTPTGGASYTTYHGQENSTHRTFSHEGTVTIRVQALSGKIGAPAE